MRNSFFDLWVKILPHMKNRAPPVEIARLMDTEWRVAECL